MSNETQISANVRAVICVGEVSAGQGKVSEQAFNDVLRSHLAKFDKGQETSEQSCLSSIGIQQRVLISNATNIHHYIFSLCDNLTFVDLRAVKGLNYLGTKTFSGFTKLKCVLLWNGLETIKASAFKGSGLESFTAPASL